MRPRTSGYTSLESLYAERESISWYWRLLAFAAPWSILAGFLILPATYDADPQLRVGLPGIAVFAIALMTAGYGSSGMLCVLCPSWLFMLESIFIPCLGTCSLSLFNIVYGFAISKRYRWNAAAIAAMVVAVVTSLVYGVLAVYTHRQLKSIRHQRPRQSSVAPERNTKTSVYLHPPNDPSITYPRSMLEDPPPQLSQEEMTRQQMLSLLSRHENSERSPDSAPQSTFRIDLPAQQSLWQSHPDLPTPRQAHERQDSRGRDIPLDAGHLEERLSSGDAPDTRSVNRSRSREERRLEIELGRR